MLLRCPYLGLAELELGSLQGVPNLGLHLEVEGPAALAGPAVDVDNLQDALGATKVRCQWDNLGLGWIVYPKAYGDVRRIGEDEELT